MPTFSFQNKQIYYALDGEKGEPLLFLNGIMMSTASWNSFVADLSANNRFIRLDLLDQGQSARMDDQPVYDQKLQAEVVKALLVHLQLSQVTIMGVSYGGEVAMHFAVKYPEYVKRLMLFNTTAHTNEWLRDIGRGWNEVGATLNGSAYYSITIPVIYSSTFYVNNIEWMNRRQQLLIPLFSNKEFQDRMCRLVNSAESHDVRMELNKITCPTLVVSSEFDQLTPVNEQEYLRDHLPNPTYVYIPKAGHAFMYEMPLAFISLVLGFTNALSDAITI